MKLDGTIGNATAGILFIVIFVVGCNWLEVRSNPPPPLDRYRKDGGIPWIGFWNLFDERTFTPEAIEHHRRRLRSLPLTLAAFVVGWVVLDAIW